MLTDKQKHLYMLFKEVDALCRKHNIQYQLAGGTLIGAVRHKGFIPWDDDMDITMTRNNWEKFIEVCKNELPDNRILECQELNHNFHNVIARYTDKTSSAVHSTQVIANDAAGDMIDIICYDYLPDNGKAWKQYTKDITLYSDLINPAIVYSYRFRYNQFRYGWYRLKMRIKGRDKVLDDLQKKMFSYKEEDCPYVVLRWGGTPLLFRKEIFGESSNNVVFEDTVGQAPDFISDYIVEHYEDEWMFIPPAVEQGGHNSIYSLDTDYTTIRNEINHFINPEQERKKFLRKKAIAMQIMSLWMILKNFNILLTEKSKSKSFKAEFDRKCAEINNAYNQNDFEKLEEIFADFVALQFSKEFFGRDDYDNVYKYRHPVILKIQSDVADKVVAMLFNRNKISKALRFITVYEQKGKDTAYMREVKADIMLFRASVHKVSIGELGSALSEAESLINKYPFSIGVIKLLINILRKTDIQKNRNRITELLDTAFALYPDDGELEKYKLDLSYKAEGKALIPQYIKAYHKTLNGLVRLEIEEIISDNRDYFDNDNAVMDALSVLPDDKEFCLKHIDFVIKSDNVEDVYSLIEFIREKELVLEDDYIISAERVCNYLIGENGSLLAKVILCEDYDELLNLRKQAEKLDKSASTELILGDILYKLGNTAKAVAKYTKALETADTKLCYVIKKRILSDLTRLRNSFDYADSVTHFDVENLKETPASDEQKNLVREKLFSKWAESYGSIKVLKNVLKTADIADFSAENLTAEDMKTLLDTINIESTYVQDEPFAQLDPLKNKVDGPQHNDHNLTESGDYNG